MILAPTSASYKKLLLPGLVNGIDCSLIEVLIGFCHANLAHNQQSRYGLQDVIRAYHTHLDISIQLIKLFKVRFDPVLKHREGNYQILLDETNRIIENFSSGRRFLDELRREIFNCGLSFVSNTLKTNFFIPDKLALAFRLDPAYLGELSNMATQALPADRPFRVTYFHSELGMGFHIGFSDIARGGWRTIMTKGRDDYETSASTVFKECYLLAHTQHLKNKDIYQGGSKMVTILNVGDEYNIENINKFLYELQRGFINALLDIYLTEKGKPKNPLVVDYYSEDETIELGPGENLHNVMAERIADVAEKRGYFLGAGIISSKKAGINHKAYGVTSIGLVKFAEVSMKELGVDIYKDPFTIKFTGGPNGDVTGNTMSQLLDQCPFVMVNMIKDETAVFYDPLGADKKELKRILLKEDLKGLNPDTLHRGGFILYRHKTKMDGLRKLYKKVVCCSAGLIESWISNDEFHHEFDHMIFNVSADIFIPADGRPDTIDMNSFHRFINEDGSLLNRVIIESANSFITPPASVELQKRGMIIIGNASANKCGVISSSYEIIADLLLSKEEFLSIKDVYVSQVISILKKRAEDEARLIFERFKKAQGRLLYTEISNAICAEINAHYARLFDFFRQNSSYCDKPLYRKAILSHLPEIIKNNKKFDNRIDSLPLKYKAAILASEIASSLVYSGDNKATFIHMVEGHLSRI
jgi:glutamate dehydrogenase